MCQEGWCVRPVSGLTQGSSEYIFQEVPFIIIASEFKAAFSGLFTVFKVTLVFNGILVPGFSTLTMV